MKLERYRRQIDLIDAELIALLTARELLSREIGLIKTAAGIPIEDPLREAKILRGVDLQSEGSPAIREIYRTILTQSKLVQKSAVENASVGEAA